jgi:radical SAM protein with 4Fe4S-binding SPASM domain
MTFLAGADNMSSYVRENSDIPLQIHPLLGKLDLEITERCNNNCIHCCINLPVDDSAKKREISTEKIKDILTEAASLGCLKVRFTGGEPLLREHFEEIYVFARRLGLKVLLFTNATLITPQLADLLFRIPPLEKIEVSVYGMSEKSYEAVTRTPGSFHAAMRGIKLLLDRKIPFIVKAAFLPPNKGELDEFEKWASTIPWMDRAPSYSVFFDLRARRDSEKKNQLIKKLRVKPEEAVQVLSRDRNRYLQEMKQFCAKFTRVPGDKLFACGLGHGGCVDAYGIFQPCMFLRHPDTVFDLRNGSLREALMEFFPRLKERKAQNSDYLARCSRCFLHGLCEQCPGKSWMEHGTLDTPIDYLCQVAHFQALDLGLLQKGEHAWEIEDWIKRVIAFVEK